MSCTSTSSMYLNIATTICADISTSRSSGSTTVNCTVTFSESQGNSWNLNAIYAAVNGYTGWTKVKSYGNSTSGSASASFSFDAGSYDSGSRTFEILFAVFNNAESGIVGSTASFNVSASWSASATAPSTPSVSIVERYTYGAKIKVTISSWGSPSNVSSRYIEGEIVSSNNYSGTRRYRHYTAATMSESQVVGDISGTYTGGDLDIKSNTQYYYGGYATNTVKSASTIAGQFYTLPAAPVGSSFESTGTNTAQFNITDASEGSGQAIRLQYRYKLSSASSYGSWTNAGSSTGNKQTETVTLTGLTSGAAYDVQVRALAGSSDYSAVTTYSNAFTTDTVSVTLVSTSSVYNSVVSSVIYCDTTIGYIISATGSTSSTFDLYYSITDGSTTSTGTQTGVSATDSLTLTLKANTEYTITLKARPTGETDYGDAASYTFTTPTFVPGAPSITNLQWSNSLRDTVTFTITGAAVGEGETFADMAWALQLYDEANDTWVRTASATYNSATARSVTVTYADAVATEPRDYPKMRIVASQTNTIGQTSAENIVVFRNQPYIKGRIVKADGTKLDLVGITKVKKSDGTLLSGIYRSPFVVK